MVLGPPIMPDGLSDATGFFAPTMMHPPSPLQGPFLPPEFTEFVLRKISDVLDGYIRETTSEPITSRTETVWDEDSEEMVPKVLFHHKSNIELFYHDHRHLSGCELIFNGLNYFNFNNTNTLDINMNNFTNEINKSINEILFVANEEDKDVRIPYPRRGKRRSNEDVTKIETSNGNRNNITKFSSLLEMKPPMEIDTIPNLTAMKTPNRKKLKVQTDFSFHKTSKLRAIINLVETMVIEFNQLFLTKNQLSEISNQVDYVKQTKCSQKILQDLKESQPQNIAEFLEKNKSVIKEFYTIFDARDIYHDSDKLRRQNLFEELIRVLA